MKIIEVKICDTIYKISCHEKDEDHIILLADNFNDKVMKFFHQMQTKNKNLAIIMAAISLEDELYDFKHSEGIISGEINNITTITNTIDTISDYLENLSKKINEILKN